MRLVARRDEPGLEGVDEACTRSRRPSLPSRWETCVLTVASESTSASAISALARPAVGYAVGDAGCLRSGASRGVVVWVDMWCLRFGKGSVPRTCWSYAMV